MGDCFPIEFICEHHLTFSKSLLRVIPKKELRRNPKNQRVFDRGKGELENAEGSEHWNLYLHLKWLFRMLSNCFFNHKQSRALFCLQDKGVAQSII